MYASASFPSIPAAATASATTSSLIGTAFLWQGLIAAHLIVATLSLLALSLTMMKLVPMRRRRTWAGPSRAAIAAREQRLAAGRGVRETQAVGAQREPALAAALA